MAFFDVFSAINEKNGIVEKFQMKERRFYLLLYDHPIELYHQHVDLLHQSRIIN